MNKVFFIGNLTNDPVKQTTSSGISVTKFSIAVQRRFQREGEESADFFNIVAWRQTADFCANYLKKGKKVAVTGSIQIRKYEANDGSQRTAVDVTADEVESLSPRDSDSTSNTRVEDKVELQEVQTESNLPF